MLQNHFQLAPAAADISTRLPATCTNSDSSALNAHAQLDYFHLTPVTSSHTLTAVTRFLCSQGRNKSDGEKTNDVEKLAKMWLNYVTVKVKLACFPCRHGKAKRGVALGLSTHTHTLVV